MVLLQSRPSPSADYQLHTTTSGHYKYCTFIPDFTQRVNRLVTKLGVGYKGLLSASPHLTIANVYKQLNHVYIDDKMSLLCMI